MVPDIYWLGLLLILSPCIGSFLGVLVARLPAEKSLFAPSCCDACGKRLIWKELVPILSALALRHRCRYCGAPIPGVLLRIEILAFSFAVFSVIAGGNVAEI